MTEKNRKYQLKDALPPASPEVREAVYRTAESVQEERCARLGVKHLRPVVLAVVLVLCGMTAAVAAGLGLGWGDYLKRAYQVDVPQPARDALEQRSETSFTVGPVTFTLKESLADPYNAWVSFRAEMTDGMPGELLSEVIYEGEEDRNENLPRYLVRGCLEMSEPYSGGSAMEDAALDEDGNLTLFNLHELAGLEPQTEVPVKYYFKVTELDPETGAEVQSWQDESEGALKISPQLAKRTYLPEREVSCEGYELLRVDAELYPTGAYLYLVLKAPKTITKEEFQDEVDIWGLAEIRDERGEPFMSGMSLGGEVVLDSWPEIEIADMVSVEELPETMLVVMGEESVAVR